MKRVFIIHGWEGRPEEGWFPWLKKELEDRGFEVKVPAMPDSATPLIEKWVGHIESVVGQPDAETFLIGHSIGCQAVLRYIEKLPEGQNVGNVVLVAGWIHRLDGDLSDEEKAIAKPWLETPIDLEKVRSKCKNITAIFSNNDIWVRLSEENEHIFADKLGAKIIIEHGKGHMNDESNTKELPSALEAIL